MRWSLLLALCACRTLPHLPDATLEQLKATPAGYLQGTVAGLHPPRVLNDVDYVYDAKWANDSHRLALSRLGMKNFDVLVWALEQPPKLIGEAPVNPHAFDVECMAFSPDGVWVAAVSRDGSVRMFDAATRKLIGDWIGTEPLTTVAFHPGGGFLAVGGEQGTVTLLATAPLRVATQLKVHEEQVRGLAFASDGRLFTGSWDKTLAVLSTAEGLVETARFTFPAFINDLSLDRAGKVLGVAFSESKAQRSPEVYLREQRGELEPERTWDVGARVDATTGAILQTWPGHRGVVATAAISPDGSTLVTGGWDRRLLLHITPTPVIAKFGGALRRARFSPDGRWLAVAAWTPQNAVGDHKTDPSAMVWELAWLAATVQ